MTDHDAMDLNNYIEMFIIHAIRDEEVDVVLVYVVQFVDHQYCTNYDLYGTARQSTRVTANHALAELLMIR